MELKNFSLVAKNKGVLNRLLKWVNLRPEESDRTLLMFAFYTITSIGLRWSEDSTVALFLDQYGAKSLPWIYIASAALGSVLVFFYSWLQKIFPLRLVIVAIAPFMFVPLILLPFGLQVSPFQVISIFLLRLWVDAFYIVNDLNTSIAANQLFNIREIKRTYPLISSGILVADVLSGFSLPLLLLFVGLHNVIVPFAASFIVLGTLILWYLTHNYRQAFPNTPQRLISTTPRSTKSRLTGSVKRYALLLFAFFALLQVMGILIDFQYLTQLKLNYNDKQIASFLGIFGGITGLCELTMQWFISSRLLERSGVFVAVATLPASVIVLIPIVIPILGLFVVIQGQNFFWGLVIIKFLDELLRYTFVASSGPLLFQPIPAKIRSRVQTFSSGVAEAFGAGTAGVVILVTLWLCTRFLPINGHDLILLLLTAIAGMICLGVIWLLQKGYVELLVSSAEQGQISASNIDLPLFKQVVVKTLSEKSTEADKRSCIELLSQFDLQGAAEVLASMLVKLSPDLQKCSLEVMQAAGANAAYLPEVRTLAQQENLTPEVFALSLRYIWLAEQHPDLGKLEEYLHPQENSLIRGTAAALLLRQGTPMQKVAAMHTLRKMLTHKLELERMNGVKVLREAVYLQALRIHIPNLLQDDSLRVRHAVLEMIVANQLEEYYSALLTGLCYKSTRTTAMLALVQLENEALPMLLSLATNIYKPDVVRMYAWRTIGQIPTLEAMDILWQQLEIFRGKSRDCILRTLLKRQQKEEIISLVDGLYQNKVETLIEQELSFLGEIYAAYIDFKTQGEISAAYINFKRQNTLEKTQMNQKLITILSLVERALLELEIDVKERLMMLLKLIYSQDNIQAAAFNLRSESALNLARGLEILEHTVNLPSKSVLVNIFDRRSQEEKLQHLVSKGMAEYQEMGLSDRTRRLISLGNLLSDWCLACCFHFAQVAYIPLTIPEIIATLRHPTGFVREAAIAYLSVVSPRVLLELLPQLKNDPHPLVVAQVKKLMVDGSPI
ncbi:MFS transporter [Plectonema radiosum NIES-515]|uniref:MFS transporter n=1 Tax=Plectonema radiosum NIES-515 TaxID=2986073 RepID=A0ABT3B6L9_9CYAN|nr:MFS transporter [Plectonema radiosum]MCV3217021.1 MFS transporter [Plectonema radiosum NIES-515]